MDRNLWGFNLDGINHLNHIIRAKIDHLFAAIDAIVDRKFCHSQMVTPPLP